MTTQGTPAVTTAGPTSQQRPGGGTDVKERTEQVRQTTLEQSSQVGQTAAEQAQNVAGEVKQQTHGLVREFRGQLGDQADSQRDRLVSTLREVGDQLRQMADTGDRPGVANDLVREAASRVDDVCGYLQQRRPGDLLEEVRSFARRRPGTFLVGAAAAGLLTGRLTRGARAASSRSSSGGGARRVGTPRTTDRPTADPTVRPSADPVAGMPDPTERAAPAMPGRGEPL